MVDFKNRQEKWQKIWKDQSVNAFDKNNLGNKFYVLEMFAYPSASNLHIGHCYNYVPADAYARFKKMQGFNVFQPMGFDAFGLPAENYAIKTGIHPQECTLKNISIMEKQLDSIAPMYDWSNTLVTCLPDYYRWTQHLFLQFYKHGLVYQKHAPVNWCTSCNTAIANEQVVDSTCERCGAEVVKKNLNQWFFKITDYAEELLEGLDTIDWPEKTKAMQRNWIGKSVGGEISFPLENGEKITVFTTRADTLMGVSYVVLAPDHYLVEQLTTPAQQSQIKDYQIKTSKLTDIERLSDKAEKTGVFTGSYCTHPITKLPVPIYIADYCLSTYGTGAVMGVPAHDTRDFDFAQKYNLPITRVIAGDGINDALPFTQNGTLVNSGEFDGLETETAKTQILDSLAKIGLGNKKINYRLRDWSVSRQRYWGCPIPIIHCDHCGAVPVPESDLPVTLPMDVNFAPDGKSPLLSHKGFMETTCPICGKKAHREPDTLDTFVCSSWYFLRYPDNKNAVSAFDSDVVNKMLPVDVYVGGAEHACMHLLYSRFFVKALRDMGKLNFSEPFKRLIHQGMILGADGEKMSKSKGNVINPDKYIGEFGIDALRLYLMFGFSYVDGGPWSEEGMRAVPKFIDRLERIILLSLESRGQASEKSDADSELEYALNYCIKCVRNDIEAFSFNTAVARIMELTNAMYKYSLGAINHELFYTAGQAIIRLIAPFMPYFAEELNQISGQDVSVFTLPYPDFDADKLVKNKVEIAVQINSKIVGRITIATDLTDEQIAQIAIEQIPQLQDKSIKKTIIIKGRLINFIAS